MIRATILGATGYSGGELLRILSRHPGVQIQHLTSESSAGQPIESIHPGLRGRFSHRFEKLSIGRVASDSDVVFSCYPPTIGMKSCAQLVRAGVRVIDLSADFRLPTNALFRTWYKKSHLAPQFLKKAVYGLPELFRAKIGSASLVANPGCYSTAAILAAYPLIKNGLVDTRSLIVDAKSGVSGAGKKMSLNYMFSEVDSNFQAYGVASHRHQPEMEVVLNKFSRNKIQITFSPHLVPMVRGILSVLYATLKKSMNKKDLLSVYQEMYQGEPFVRLLPDNELPQTKNVTHSNYCDIGITQDPRTKRVIVVSAIDNLVKGASGQAVQNMNLMFNYSEIEGLQ